ncbi:acyl-CoA synthetase [Streptacidiphilus fuscans]|uniref:Acyl-CoA synthetase n=1 Tax=Streptacidiphilus fuscans TaxID=2789292 RepID=A0A931B481_9ACTN|nr:acyl-CoA synthetase [Streptacidiphilus fuscans]MBF9069941.1 acyl-CoA synthetase [Streptacidiphilus fuscans]
MEFNLADLFEQAVDHFPEREAISCATVDGRAVQRRTFAELDERANRLAHHLSEAGLGPGDRIAVYALNCVEWVESLLAICKVRAVCVNVNYRYVTDELTYLLGMAEPTAMIYQERFADRVAEVRPGLSGLRHLIVIEEPGTGASDVAPARDVAPAGDVAPGLGTALPAVPYEKAVASGGPQRDFAPRSADDHYLLFTGGTTGLPKGVVWRQEDVFFALGGGIDVTNGHRMATPEEIATTAYDNPVTFLPIAPLMHGATQWALMQQLFRGNRAVLVDRFDADRVWQLVGSEKVNVVMITGDAMGRPLVEALGAAVEASSGPGAGASEGYDVTSLFGLVSSAALFSAPVKNRFLDLLPNLYLSDAIGSSEGGAGGVSQWSAADREGGGQGSVTTKPIGDSDVVDDDLNPLPAGVVGRLARRGNIPLCYLGDPAKSAEVFRTAPDGTRYAVPGDWARREEDGRITLLGRGSSCINSGGEKVFPEEVESAIKAHPAVYDTVVVGAPDERWGETVVALVHQREGQPELTLEALQAHCRAHVAGYKVPRRLRLVPLIERTPTGKPDMRWAKQAAAV